MSEMPVSSMSSQSFLQVWLGALTKPREETYVSIATSPRARAMTGYLWVYIGSLISTLAASVARGAQIGRQLQDAGVGTDQFGSGTGGIVFALLCAAPFLAVIAVLFFAGWAAVVQWIAGMFGGTGTNDRLAYTLAAIVAPYSLVSAIAVLLSSIPFVGFCFNALLGLAGLYVLFLEITAIKAVNGFGWGPAVGAYLIPGLAVFLVVCCAVAAVLSLLGMAVGDVWSTIDLNSLPIQ